MSFNPKTINWWHEQLADWMLLNPDQPLYAAATVFGVSTNYIYMIKNSDAFKAYWSLRRRNREAHMDGQAGEVLGSLQDKVSVVAEMALDQMIQQLDKNQRAPVMQHDELRSTAEMALKKLGYGIAGTGAPGMAGGGQLTQVNVNVDAGLLAAAREKMLAKHGVKPAAPALIEYQEQEEEVTVEVVDDNDGRSFGESTPVSSRE